MRNSCCILFLVLATGFLFSCEQKVQDKKFFDVPGYFKNEIKYIKQTFRTIIKTTIYNADSSITEFKVSDINWEKEFAIFLESDINKPIYYANGNNGGAPSWHGPTDQYHATDAYFFNSKKLNIQSVILEHKEAGERIAIVISKSNLISNTNIRACYEKNVSYEIWGQQKIKLSGETNTFFIQGKLK